MYADIIVQLIIMTAPMMSLMCSSVEFTVMIMQPFIKVTPSEYLVSGPLPSSNYNNCNFSLLLVLRICNYDICHFTHAYLYLKSLFPHY